MAHFQEIAEMARAENEEAVKWSDPAAGLARFNPNAGR